MNNFAFKVVALDSFSKVFRDLNDTASKTLRPVVQVQRQISALGRELHFDKISKGFRSVSVSAQKISSSLGLASGPLESLFGLGAAGGIVAAGAAVATLATRWSSAGFEIGRTATSIGVSTDQLQGFRGAAKLAGLSSDEMTAALAALGTTLQDAQFGRNSTAYMLLNRFGINIKRNKDGIVDTSAALMDLSRVISQIADPHVQDLIANAFGVGSQLPLLRQGPDVIQAYIAKTAQLGAVMGGQALADAKAYTDGLNRLKVTAEGLFDTLGTRLFPLLNRAGDLMSKSVSERGIGGLASDIFWGKATWNMAFGGAAPGQQRASGVVTGGPPAGNLPIGMRMHNLGNLMNPGGAGFQSFPDDDTGLSAMASQLRRYQNNYGLNTIQGIIGRYASGKYPGNSPATEAGYIADVSKQTGYAPGQALDLNDSKQMAPLLSAMVRHEQGRQPATEEQYQRAAAETVVHVKFANAPPGTTAEARSGGAGMPVTISYSLPTTGDLP